MIDILVPVLGRPQNLWPLVHSIEMATRVQHSLLFLCSEGDKEQIAACADAGVPHDVYDYGGRHEYPQKMNRGFSLTDAPFCLLAADDLDFQAGWEVELLRVAEESGAGVIGSNDCANPQVKRGDFSTHPLVRRTYIKEYGGALEGPGVLVSESYDHNYVDRELCHLAQSRGQWAFAGEARIAHRHPGWGTAPRDATYDKGRRMMARDHALFMRRARHWGGVGLLPEEQGRRQRRRR